MHHTSGVGVEAYSELSVRSSSFVVSLPALVTLSVLPEAEAKAGV